MGYLKAARTNKLNTAVLSTTSTKKETVQAKIRTIRQEFSHKSWIKIVLASDKHLTYNMYIEILCAFFPKKAVVQQPKAPVSESDDDSDVEFAIPQHQPQQPDAQIEDPSSDSEADEESEENPEEESEESSEEEPEQEQDPGHGYNLRRAGRRLPAHLQDYVTYTIVPHQ